MATRFYAAIDSIGDAIRRCSNSTGVRLLLVPVERRPADLGLFGDGGEGDRLSRGGEFGAIRSILTRAFSLMRSPIAR